MSGLVNYGAPVIWVQLDTPFRGVRAEHDGPDGHEHMKPGEQCECGMLDLCYPELDQ